MILSDYGRQYDPLTSSGEILADREKQQQSQMKIRTSCQASTSYPALTDATGRG